MLFLNQYRKSFYDLQMLESVKPVIKSFQNIVGRPVSVQAPQHSFDTITLKNISKQLGESKLIITSATIQKGIKLRLLVRMGLEKVVFSTF